MDVRQINEVERQKWRAKRREAEDDCEEVVSLLEKIVPKDKSDQAQWKKYYVERVKLLENSSLNIVSRLLCTNCKNKKELVQEYFDVLEALQLNVDAQDDLSLLEAEAKSLVDSEVSRLKAEQPQFFE
jgi:hypothetical protein